MRPTISAIYALFKEGEAITVYDIYMRLTGCSDLSLMDLSMISKIRNVVHRLHSQGYIEKIGGIDMYVHTKPITGARWSEVKVNLWQIV